MKWIVNQALISVRMLAAYVDKILKSLGFETGRFAIHKAKAVLFHNCSCLNRLCFSDKDQVTVAHTRQSRGHLQWGDGLYQVISEFIR